ncbi:hypothetical protein BC939DRAFT_185577 [Gamsiella multidivaricata]|uniref:uncharacterized protein n=1 Tax=Gamsiella multidivaricata TaxID=101098 RepID=UPI00221FDD95|nr:uncharacterized protein BC939DRAFT_185577 [Gamsiella multidivaricata]KAI7831424.1 hypothetical protein BC939DRAFT_185577 [Gamsiella multidivaricata]
MVVTKPQPIDPIISESREGKPFSSGLCINMAVVVKHLPIAINEIQQPIPISVLKSASSRLLQYVVSHGQNVYLDWESSQLYILFDTTDSKDGVEIPIWVIIWILGSIVISAVAWGLSEMLLCLPYDVRLTGLTILLELGFPGLSNRCTGIGTNDNNLHVFIQSSSRAERKSGRGAEGLKLERVDRKMLEKNSFYISLWE